MSNRITNRDLAIGVLSVMATVLLTALILVQTLMPREAVAFGQSASAGRLLLTTAKLDEATDLLVIADPSAEKMNVYGLDPHRGSVILLDQIELDRLPKGEQDEARRGHDVDNQGGRKPVRENPPGERAAPRDQR